jgi:hypothetical protein
VAAGVQDGHDHGHQRQCERDVPGAQPAEQSQRQRGEVVGDLVLVELGGPEPDDRQDAEEAEPQPGGHGAVRQGDRDRQHADVDAEVGDDQVPAPVAGEVDPEGEQADGEQVGGVQSERR